MTPLDLVVKDLVQRIEKLERDVPQTALVAGSGAGVAFIQLQDLATRVGQLEEAERAARRLVVEIRANAEARASWAVSVTEALESIDRRLEALEKRRWGAL